MDLQPKYIELLAEPWFTLISLGLKTVGGGKNIGRFKEIQPGDIVQWVNNDFKPRTILTKIIEGLNKCLPGQPDLEHGLSVYFKYYTKDEENEFGVLAIRFELIKIN